jgi:hypothetical protein
VTFDPGTSPAWRYRPTPITRPEDTGGTFRYRVVLVAGTAAVIGYVSLASMIMARTAYDTWIALVLAPVLLVVALPVLVRMLDQVEPDVVVRRVVVAGLVAKLAVAFIRFGVNEFVLGHADAEAYYLYGSTIAAELRQFVFGGPAYQAALPDLTGTRFIRLLTGLVYVVTGSTHLGGYVIYSFMSYWGLYLMYRAYGIAVPDGLRRRYVSLLFFLPSTVFWPSSIGKEAWMTTMLGIGSYGVARLLTQQRYGYSAILAAIAGMVVVRPHVAALLCGGLGAAFLLRRSQGTGNMGRKVVGLLVLAALAGAVAAQLQAFFGLESLDAQQVLDETARRSSTGGSEFEAVQPTSIIGLPWAAITVLFRPFLFEATSVAALVSALEGTVLIGLFLYNLPRLARLPAIILRRPYLGYVVVYSLLFTFAFSSINNFGILARQRTQLFPLVIAVLTVPYQPVLRRPAGGWADQRAQRPFADGGGESRVLRACPSAEVLRNRNGFVATSAGTGDDPRTGDPGAVTRPATTAASGEVGRRRILLPFGSNDDRLARWVARGRVGTVPGGSAGEGAPAGQHRPERDRNG